MNKFPIELFIFSNKTFFYSYTIYIHSWLNSSFQFKIWLTSFYLHIVLYLSLICIIHLILSKVALTSSEYGDHYVSGMAMWGNIGQACYKTGLRQFSLPYMTTTDTCWYSCITKPTSYHQNTQSESYIRRVYASTIFSKKMKLKLDELT